MLTCRLGRATTLLDADGKPLAHRSPIAPHAAPNELSTASASTVCSGCWGIQIRAPRNCMQTWPSIQVRQALEAGQ
jgi:hypothetical protein